MKPATAAATDHYLATKIAVSISLMIAAAAFAGSVASMIGRPTTKWLVPAAIASRGVTTRAWSPAGRSCWPHPGRDNREAFTQLTLNGRFLADRIRRYLVQHPYVHTVVLNCFNAGGGRLLAIASAHEPDLPLRRTCHWYRYSWTQSVSIASPMKSQTLCSMFPI